MSLINDNSLNITQVVNTNGLEVKNKLYVDATNNRVGIKTTTPAKDLDVNGNINTNGFILKDGINVKPIIYLRQQTNGNGGSFGSGAWRTRTLNQIVIDTHNLCSLSSNQFTLSAGTYRIEAAAPTWFNGLKKIRLYNVSDSSVEIVGQNNESTSFIGDLDLLFGVFTITSSKTFKIEHRCSVSRNTYGYGIASDFITPNYYTEVYLIKLY